MKQRIALELYSVRDDLARDFEGTLRAVKEMGYEAVEFAGGFVHAAEKVAQTLKDVGLTCCGWHTPWDAVQEDKLEATIAYNKTVGNPFIIIPGLPGECTNSIAAWKATAAKFNEIAKKLAPHGMAIGYHNHDAEFRPVEGEVPFDVFFGSTAPEVVMQLDNGNAMHGGADVCELIRRYPGRARTVHLKPYSRTEGFDAVIGKDDIPWAEFMKLCAQVGKSEWYIVEYESEALYAPLTGVKLCLDALREMQQKGII